MKGTMGSLILAGLVLAMTGAKVASATPMTFEISSYNGQGVYGTYNGSLTTEYGGALTVTLNGDTLTNVYCVDPFTTIYPAPSVYSQTTVNTTGSLANLPFLPLASKEEIAWLMETYANSPTVDQSALQGAIWHLEGNVDVDSGTSYYNDYETYLGAASGKSDPLNDLVWINPSQNGSTYEQGFAALISSNPSVPSLATVPEPSSLTLLGLGLVALLRKRRRNVE